MLLKALSPNGKALDSDSSIFQVRILVALLTWGTVKYHGVFFIFRADQKESRLIRDDSFFCH